MTQAISWGDFALDVGATERIDFGALHFTLRRTETEVWTRAQHTDEANRRLDSDWNRWAVPDYARLTMRPAVPDRLGVVSHSHPFHLPTGSVVDVFIRIPLCLQLTATFDDTTDLVIADVPSMILSDTWWGTFTEGELAYWISTKARASVSDDLFLPHIGMCPLRLENGAEAALPCDRFAVRVPHLSLFRSGDQMWTDQVRVYFTDAAEGSEIDFTGVAPDEAKNAVPMAQPRVPAKKGFQARTFDRLKSLSPLGF